MKFPGASGSSKVRRDGRMIIGGSITIHTNEITHRDKNITEGHTHVGMNVCVDRQGLVRDLVRG